jgi:hypothetical protein
MTGFEGEPGQTEPAEPAQPLPPPSQPEQLLPQPQQPTSVTVTIGGGFWRGFSKWVVGGLLTVVLGTLLLSLTATQLTAPGTAHKVLRRTIASLTEIDALLAQENPPLVTTTSNEAGTATQVRLARYPIDIPLSASETEGLSTSQLRDLVLDRSADEVFEKGFSAFRESPGGASSDIQLLSPPGAVRYTAGFLTADNHDVMQVVTTVLVGVAAFLALLLVLLSRGYGRLTSVGTAVVVAALPFLILSVTLRFVLRLASQEESDYLAAQLYSLGKDVAWLPVRNGIAFAGLGVIFLTLGLAFSLLADRRRSVLR